MQAPLDRRSIDLSGFPDLVMILLGFRLKGWRGLRAMRQIGPGLNAIARDRPDGLLAQENLRFGLLHFGFRQYWRDIDALERFTRSAPHADWWRNVRDLSAGAGFWHETYHARGGMEALYVGMPGATGFELFAPPLQPVGPFLSARARLAGGAGA